MLSVKYFDVRITVIQISGSHILASDGTRSLDGSGVPHQSQLPGQLHAKISSCSANFNHICSIFADVGIFQKHGTVKRKHEDSLTKLLAAVCSSQSNGKLAKLVPEKLSLLSVSVPLAIMAMCTLGWLKRLEYRS